MEEGSGWTPDVVLVHDLRLLSLQYDYLHLANISFVSAAVLFSSFSQTPTAPLYQAG